MMILIVMLNDRNRNVENFVGQARMELAQNPFDENQEMSKGTRILYIFLPTRGNARRTRTTDNGTNEFGHLSDH
jgi:hypothetical protein